MEKFKNIEFYGDDIRIVRDGEIAEELGRITPDEMINILTEYAIENGIEEAAELLQTDKLIIKDYDAYNEFQNAIEPEIQERIDSYKKEQENIRLNVKKLYITEDTTDDTCYIEYNDGAIKRTLNENAQEELAERGYTKEQIDDITEHLSKEEEKKFIEEHGISNSQNAQDENNHHLNIKKVYIHENILWADYFIQYEDDTIKKVSKEEALQEITKYAKENNLSDEEIEQKGILEEIDEGQLQELMKQSQQPVVIDSFLIYEDLETKEIRGRIYYQDGTIEEKTEEEIQEAIQKYMEENNFESEEELEKAGILEKRLYEDDLDLSNIENFYYYFPNDDENEEAKGIICYKDGAIETVSKKELLDTINLYMEENDINDLDELIQKGKIDRLSEEEVYDLLDESKGKDNIKKEIGKIVFFSYVNANKEIVTRAMIYYTDGSSIEKSREEAEEEILKIKRANKIESTEQLFKEGFLECVTANDLYNNHENYQEEAKNYKRNKKKHHPLKWIINKLKTNKVVRWISISLASLLVLGAGAGTCKLIHNSIVGTMKNQNNLEDDNNQDKNEQEVNNMEREDFSAYNYDELIQRCKTNPTRQAAIKTIYNFINDYNLNSAYTYKEEKSSAKLSHTVDEVSAMYLLYNDISAETINKIYQQTNLTASQLRNDLINAQKQDSLAHNIQTRTLSKDRLFIEKKDKDLYNKYEKIFIDMNNTSDYAKKKEYKKTFYDTVRKDLNGMSSNSYENVDSSKIVIKEFVDAMKRVKINVNNKLTDQEEKYIDGILENVIDQKIKDIDARQNARNIAESIYFGDELLPDPNPYYEEFKKAIITELESKGSYYTTEDNRDISSYKSFKTNTKPKKEDQEKNKKEEKVNKENHTQTAPRKKEAQPQTQSTPTATTPQSNPEVPANNDIPQQQETIIEENKAKRIEIIEEIDDEGPRRDDVRDEFDDDDFKNPDTNSIVTPDDALSILDDVRRPSKDHLNSNIINTGIDEITSESINQNPTELIPSGMEDSTIEYVSPDEAQTNDGPLNETIVEFDSDKIDEQGNLSDQYTDVSTDSNAIYQTNNSEMIAEYLIAQMEQQADNYVEEDQLVR